MKIICATRPRKTASILLVALILCAVLGTLLGSFLYLTQFQIKSVARSQTWNAAMVTAEAGMEEGLSMINRYANTGTDLSVWPDVATANGWTNLGNSVYYKQRYFGSNYFQVYITNLNNTPVILSKGFGYIPLSGIYVTRAITVNTAAGSMFLGGVLAKLGIQINGSAIFDSYNSQNTNYSTLGQWDINKRLAGGNIGTIESNVVSAIDDSGSAKVYGKLATGPNSTIRMSGNATVGDIAWVNAGTKGIKPGWSRNDLNVTIPDSPPLPTGSYAAMPAAGNVVLNAMGSTSYYVATTAYQMNSQNYVMITNGKVVIDAQQGFSMNAQARIIIATNSQLIMYLGTQNSQLDGQGFFNGTGRATNCLIYGKNNCQQMEYNGGASFVGWIYAPYADITLNGNSDTSGAMVGKSFQINGNMMFHYDESLGAPQSGSSIYRILGWREL